MNSIAPCIAPHIAPSGGAPSGFGVYVHWPFCASKCPYCDFNSHVRRRVDEPAFRDALLAEVAHMAALTPERRVESVFFGGGTPSLMAPATVAAVLDAIARRWPLADEVEVTLEANPSSVEIGRLAGFAAAGIDRLSLGVQALDDAALAALGRRHSAACALAAIGAGAAAFPRLSFDLIYARPNQTVAAWEAELGRALALAEGHISLYQLTIEAGTRFHTLARRGALALPCEDRQAELWQATQAATTAAGLPAYEVSNHARPGQECRHNLLYWRSGEWVGIGPGACGRLNPAPGVAVERRQIAAPEAWAAAVARRGHGTEAVHEVRGRERLAEVLAMGLRLTRGLDEADLVRAGGCGWDALAATGGFDAMIAAGFLERRGKRVRASPAGRPVLNAVLRQLLGEEAAPPVAS